jgi:predicted HTH transcriptional regulator
MANTTKSLTNAQALVQAIQLAQDAGMTELVDKLTKMHETATKPKKKSEGPTKAQLENLQLAEKALEYMADKEGVTAKELTTNIQGIATSQKAVAVMRLAIANGKAIKFKVGSQTMYKAC